MSSSSSDPGDRTDIDRIRREIASIWWGQVPKALQVNLLKRAGLPVDFDMQTSGSQDRWRLATAADVLIGQLEPATRVKT